MTAPQFERGSLWLAIGLLTLGVAALWIGVTR